MIKDMEKAVVLNGVFTSYFTSKISLQEYQGKVWRNKNVHLLEVDQIREYIRHT